MRPSRSPTSANGKHSFTLYLICETIIIYKDEPATKQRQMQCGAVPAIQCPMIECEE